jgi:hypothetical protein
LASRVLLKIVYLLTRRALGLAGLVFRGDRAKDAELLVVRHEALVRREALGIEGGARPPRQAVAAAGQELSAA